MCKEILFCFSTLNQKCFLDSLQDFFSSSSMILCRTESLARQTEPESWEASPGGDGYWVRSSESQGCQKWNTTQQNILYRPQRSLQIITGLIGEKEDLIQSQPPSSGGTRFYCMMCCKGESRGGALGKGQLEIPGTVPISHVRTSKWPITLSLLLQATQAASVLIHFFPSKARNDLFVFAF